MPKKMEDKAKRKSKGVVPPHHYGKRGKAARARKSAKAKAKKAR